MYLSQRFPNYGPQFFNLITGNKTAITRTSTVCQQNYQLVCTQASQMPVSYYCILYVIIQDLILIIFSIF